MRAPDGKLRHFAYLDEVAIRVPKERPDFATPINGRGQKLGTPAHERFVCRAAVGHPQSQLMADAVPDRSAERRSRWVCPESARRR